MPERRSGRDSNDEEMWGLIREAMALRVKYRLKDDSDKARAKKRLMLTLLCVSRYNRGGNYPNPTTVLNWLISIFGQGFNDAEANHEGVAVQEIPAKDRPDDYVTDLEYNIKRMPVHASRRMLDADAEAAYSTLSHSHLLLTLLCWYKGWKVQVPLNEKGVP